MRKKVPPFFFHFFGPRPRPGARRGAARAARARTTDVSSAPSARRAAGAPQAPSTSPLRSLSGVWGARRAPPPGAARSGFWVLVLRTGRCARTRLTAVPSTRSAPSRSATYPAQSIFPGSPARCAHCRYTAGVTLKLHKYGHGHGLLSRRGLPSLPHSAPRGLVGSQRYTCTSMRVPQLLAGAPPSRWRVPFFIRSPSWPPH